MTEEQLKKFTELLWLGLLRNPTFTYHATDDKEFDRVVKVVIAKTIGLK